LSRAAAQEVQCKGWMLLLPLLHAALLLQVTQRLCVWQQAWLHLKRLWHEGLVRWRICLLRDAGKAAHRVLLLLAVQLLEPMLVPVV